MTEMKHPKKFIQIVPFYPLPTGQVFRENYFLWPAAMMREMGFECEFLTLNGKNSSQKELEVLDGFTVRRFSSAVKLLMYVFGQDALVHSHLRPFPPSLFLGLLPKRKLITPFTYELGSNALVRLLSLWMMRRFDKVVSISPYEEQLYLKNGFRREQVDFIPLAIDYRFYSRPVRDAAAMRKFGLKKNDFIIITVANFRYFKRVDVLLEAFKEFRKTVRNGKLVLVGEDWLAREGRPTIKEMVKELHLDSVIIAGYQPAAEIRKLFALSSLFVNTSSVESQCIAVYEAAAAGIPLCLSDIGSFTEVFREHALYHRYDDAASLASNMLQYWNDRKLAGRNAAFLKKFVKAWDYETIKRKLWAAYEAVLLT